MKMRPRTDLVQLIARLETLGAIANVFDMLRYIKRAIDTTRCS
jgi:hypothetical protein